MDCNYIHNNDCRAASWGLCQTQSTFDYWEWKRRHTERCCACDGDGHVANGEDCYYCGARGWVEVGGAPPQPPYVEPSKNCASGGDCITATDILARDLDALAREMRRVNGILKTDMAIDDECEDQDREWEVTPSEALDLCHRAYDMMAKSRNHILAFVLGAPACDVAQNARACFDALDALRWPLLSPHDNARPLHLLRSRLGFDVKRPIRTPHPCPTNPETNP